MRSPLLTIFENYVMSPLGMSLILWALSFALMLAIGRPLIGWLKLRKGMKWAPREDTPDSHLQKAGVPSMGGIGIIGAAFVALLAFGSFLLSATQIFFGNRGLNYSEFLLLLIFPLVVVFHAVLGYLDDHSKATNKGGLSSKAKLLGQIVLAVAFIAILKSVSSGTGFGFREMDSHLFTSWGFVVAALLIVIGTSNAVNLTDGIDGLAAGLSVQVAAVFSLLWLELIGSESVSFAPFSATLFWPAIGGACLGFLVFNKYPARVFMGDTGSLALGAALGAGAILTRTVWVLPFVGFIFYVEMFSVIAQVLYFKYTRRKFGEGKRLFRRAPLHHHFELDGWSEWRVVATFWGVNLVTTIIGLVLWKMGILPRFP